MVAVVSYLTSVFELQMFERLFPIKEKTLCPDQGSCYLWVIFLFLGNCSAVWGSRSKVRDDASVTKPMKAGSCFRNVTCIFFFENRKWGTDKQGFVIAILNDIYLLCSITEYFSQVSRQSKKIARDLQICTL